MNRTSDTEMKTFLMVVAALVTMGTLAFTIYNSRGDGGPQVADRPPVRTAAPAGGGPAVTAAPADGSRAAVSNESGSYDCVAVYQKDQIDNDPAQIALYQACRDLSDLQASAGITNVELVSSGAYAANVKVTVKMLSCETECVSEMEKTYELFVNSTKWWEVKEDYGDNKFRETESSKTRRLEELARRVFSGVIPSLLASQAELVTSYEIHVPVSLEYASWPQELAGGNSRLLIEATWPDGEPVTFGTDYQVPMPFTGTLRIPFSQFDKAGGEGTMVTLKCIRVATLEGAWSECIPPTIGQN